MEIKASAFGLQWESWWRRLSRFVRFSSRSRRKQPLQLLATSCISISPA